MSRAEAAPSVCRCWLNRRQIDGSLNRTPAGFYDRLWQILERTPNGLVVAGKHLPQVLPGVLASGQGPWGARERGSPPSALQGTFSQGASLTRGSVAIRK